MRIEFNFKHYNLFSHVILQWGGTIVLRCGLPGSKLKFSEMLLSSKSLAAILPVPTESIWVIKFSPKLKSIHTLTVPLGCTYGSLVVTIFTVSVSTYPGPHVEIRTAK